MISYRKHRVYSLCASILIISSPVYSSLRIGFAGDTMLGRLVNKKLRSVKPSYPWGNMLPFLLGTDLNIVNLETALTQSTSAAPKVFNFKSDPKNTQSLKEANIKIVNLANNHSLDFGVSGLKDTLKALDQAGILHVGAGMNKQEAAQPAVMTVNNIKIGVIGYTDNEPTRKAGHDKPGTNYIKIGDIKAVENDIKKLRQTVDLLIVSIHWGPNLQERPPQEFITFAHNLVDLGVDIMHGHSDHIFQAVEDYHGKLIMYQMGDFVDDYMIDPVMRNDRSFLFIVDADKTRIKNVELIPTIIQNMQVNKATGKDYHDSTKRIQMLSADRATVIGET